MVEQLRYLIQRGFADERDESDWIVAFQPVKADYRGP
jgi:hypothetical protein